MLNSDIIIGLVVLIVIIVLIVVILLETKKSTASYTSHTQDPKNHVNPNIPINHNTKSPIVPIHHSPNGPVVPVPVPVTNVCPAGYSLSSKSCTPIQMSGTIITPADNYYKNIILSNLNNVYPYLTIICPSGLSLTINNLQKTKNGTIPKNQIYTGSMTIDFDYYQIYPVVDTNKYSLLIGPENFQKTSYTITTLSAGNKNKLRVANYAGSFIDVNLTSESRYSITDQMNFYCEPIRPSAALSFILYINCAIDIPIVQ